MPVFKDILEGCDVRDEVRMNPGGFGTADDADLIEGEVRLLRHECAIGLNLDPVARFSQSVTEIPDTLAEWLTPRDHHQPEASIPAISEPIHNQRDV